MSFAFCVFIAGCYDRKVTGVLNPDGSAKVVIQTDAAVPAAGAAGQPKPDAMAYGRQLATDFIINTQGVDAWSDVSVSSPQEGSVRIMATAYVGDLARLRFFNLPLAATWQKQADGTYQFRLLRPTGPATRASGGPSSQAASAPAAPRLSDAEVKRLVAEAQAEYKEEQLAMQTGLNAFTLRLTYTLPGTVREARILSVDDGRTVSVVLDGKKIAQVLDKFMADDAALAASFRAGRESTDSDDYLLEGLYGKKGPAVATVADVADKPVFDYKAELAAAQAVENQMLKDAGIELPRLQIRLGPATTQRE